MKPRLESNVALITGGASWPRCWMRPGAGGPCYQWTRKVRAKTVSVALSREQYEGLREAIPNWR